jgi:gamma-glutamyltranspeptidase/glutathione hydrolase
MTPSIANGRRSTLAAVALIALLAGCAQPGPKISAPPLSGPSQPRPIASQPTRQAAATANPLATRAALAMLERGGAPIDAAIAAQMVLGLVEPQSSGLGGGSLLLVWDQRSQLLASYDGLAAAPARVTPGLNIDVDGSAIAPGIVDRGGRSVGVPGTLAVLAQAHRRHGRLPWSALFAPAIELAERGFPLPPYLHGILSVPTAAADHPDLLALFFGADGKVLPVGTKVVNPAYGKTLRHIAEVGTAGLWEDPYGAAIVAAAQRGTRPSLMTQADLAAYRSRERDPLCGPFLAYTVCMMAPPSFGGVVVLQTLQLLQARPIAPGQARFDFDDPAFVHWFAEAGRLAQADRQRYVGDPDFVAVPTHALVAQHYLAQRAAKVDPQRAAVQVEAGAVEEQKGSPTPVALDVPLSEPADATSQLAIVDGQGDALSMTTTINLNFGSRLLANGFVLNNALTNFSAPPQPGQRAPNRMEAGKRPVTSMAPTIVFDRASGLPVVVGGSAGGGQIVDYISQSLVEMLANGRTPAEALARGHVSTAVRGKLQLEAGTPAAALAAALRAKGHDVAVVPMTSGLGFLLQRGDGWIGAADPRRDGLALGQ